jgi:hypothetical protein
VGSLSWSPPRGADEIRGLAVARDRRADVRLAGRDRRLSKDDEGLAESSKSWIDIAMTHLVLRRLESV